MCQEKKQLLIMFKKLLIFETNMVLNKFIIKIWFN
jgi:hypothetical protein